MIHRTLLALAASAFAAPAHACRLALLFALDVSASVDAAEDRLQREGLAAAMLAPEVARAILGAPENPVAFAAFEWSGNRQQHMILDWRLVVTADDLHEVADQIAASRRIETEFPTSIGYALGYAAGVLRRAPRCDRRTIDMSADGLSNDGFPPRLAYANFPLGGVTVNGLVIGGETDLGALVPYFRTEVLRGPDAFVETADGYDDYERAMRRKLLRELAPPVFGSLQ